MIEGDGGCRSSDESSESGSGWLQATNLSYSNLGTGQTPLQSLVSSHQQIRASNPLCWVFKQVPLKYVEN